MIEYLSRLFATPAQVVSADEKFNAASALSAYAVSTFDRVVLDLEEANADLLAVADEVAEEMERLALLKNSALRQAGQNGTVITNIQRLVGSTS